VEAAKRRFSRSSRSQRRRSGQSRDGVVGRTPASPLGAQKRGVLHRESVLRLAEDEDEVVLGQRIELDPDWEATLQFGDKVGRLATWNAPRL